MDKITEEWLEDHFTHPNSGILEDGAYSTLPLLHKALNTVGSQQEAVDLADLLVAVNHLIAIICSFQHLN